MAESVILLVTSTTFLGGLSSLWFLGSRLDALGSRPVLSVALFLWVLETAGWLLLAGGRLPISFWVLIGLQFFMGLLAALVTMANVRQALVPGVFFGLNLAVFFAGATHNSVANAALIGSLAPFLIVPAGAWLFREYIDPRALVFAFVAFGGVSLVLFSAPPNGDASLEGNVFGFVAMLLLVAYVVSTKHFRQDMDVTTFMATICPIAAVAVLPLAIAHGGVFALSGTGWAYMLILTFTSGVVAQGLVVFAQKSIQIGTIAIAQVAQPALAVVWSFLLLSGGGNHRQVAGIAVVVAGLLAFVVLNQRGDRTRREDEERAKVIASQGSGVAV